MSVSRGIIVRTGDFGTNAARWVRSAKRVDRGRVHDFFDLSRVLGGIEDVSRAFDIDEPLPPPLVWIEGRIPRDVPDQLAIFDRSFHGTVIHDVAIKKVKALNACKIL